MFSAGDDKFCMAHFPAERRRGCQKDVFRMACYAVGDSSEAMSQFRDACRSICKVDMEVVDTVVLKGSG
jgi:hypothetical protein